MPEATQDAMFLITISWEALNRSAQEDNDSRISDHLITMFFSVVFIEANLNYIVNYLSLSTDLISFYKNRPGLRIKLCYFYNRFIARKKVNRYCQLKNIDKKIQRKFKDFNQLNNFRDNLAHGYVDPNICTIKNARSFRKSAKDIVDELFKVLEKKGYKIERKTTYDEVIKKYFKFNYPNLEIPKMPSS